LASTELHIEDNDVAARRGRVNRPRHAAVVQDDYWFMSAEASFSACFAADLLSVELIVGLSV
jgi:hypothetical protein